MRRFSKLVYVSLKNSFFILVKVFVTRQDSPPGEGHRCVWLARLLLVESLPPCQGVILADTPSVVAAMERNQRKFQLMLSLWPLPSIDTQFYVFVVKDSPSADQAPGLWVSVRCVLCQRTFIPALVGFRLLASRAPIPTMGWHEELFLAEELT